MKHHVLAPPTAGAQLTLNALMKLVLYKHPQFIFRARGEIMALLLHLFHNS